jgi:DNA-binding NtrC family response regulator
MRRLMAYSWPGNVRQLENLVERALALSPGRSQLELADFPAEIQHADVPVPRTPAVPDEGMDFDAYIAAIEHDLIKQSLARTNGNKRQAAQLLNLKRTTLIEKLKRLERN